MLMLVRDDDTPRDVQARLAAQELTLAEIAAAPVRFVPTAFLAAVAGLFTDLLPADVYGNAAL